MRLQMNQTLKSLKIFKYQYSVRFEFIPCTLDANIHAQFVLHTTDAVSEEFLSTV